MKHSILLCIFILTGCSNTSYKIAAQEAVVEEPKILQETKQDMEEQPKEIKEIEINIPEEDCLVFDGFSEVSEYRWEIVNDGVM